jgi:hypothetical protein
MKKLLLLFCCLFAFFTLSAQSTSYRAGNCKTKSNYCPKWSLFHETTYNFAGLGINSVNADVIVMCNRSYMASIRFGINYFTFPRISAAGVPLEFNFMIGRGAWLLETGLGVDYLYVYKNYTSTSPANPNNISYLALTGRIGVRYEKVNGLFFRAGYNPHVSLLNRDMIEPISKHAFLHMLSVGIGYTFNN